MCQSRTSLEMRSIIPKHPAHGDVMLCTVQCRPASACTIKSPPRGYTQKKQDKTRQKIDRKESTYQARSVEGFRTGPPPDMSRWRSGLCLVACRGRGRMGLVRPVEEMVTMGGSRDEGV